MLVLMMRVVLSLLTTGMFEKERRTVAAVVTLQAFNFRPLYLCSLPQNLCSSGYVRSIHGATTHCIGCLCSAEHVGQGNGVL